MIRTQTRIKEQAVKMKKKKGQMNDSKWNPTGALYKNDIHFHIYTSCTLQEILPHSFDIPSIANFAFHCRSVNFFWFNSMVEFTGCSLIVLNIDR